jgi:hypothetical protein
MISHTHEERRKKRRGGEEDNLGFRTQFRSLLVAYAMGAEDHVTQLLGGLLHLAGKKQCGCGYNLQTIINT